MASIVDKPLSGRVTLLEDNYIENVEVNKGLVEPPEKTKAQMRTERRAKKRLEIIEAKKLIMRDTLCRELELSKRADYRGQVEWEEMCRKIKSVELRDELLHWNERLQCQLRYKNEKIELCIDEMQSIYEQQKKLYSNTVELIDHIIACYHVLLNSLKNMYDVQVDELLTEYYKEIKQYSKESDFMQMQTENIMHALNVVTIDTLRTDYDIYLEKRDDCVNTEIEKRFDLRNQIVSKMEAMHEQLVEFVDTLRNTELDANKYKRISWLTERQLAFVEESKKLKIKEIQYTSAINELNHEILNFENETTDIINRLRQDLTYFQNVRQKLNCDIKEDSKITYNKLQVLTSSCYELIKDMKKHVKQGELLLSVSANCRKLQTQSEKIVVGGEAINSLNSSNDNFNEHFQLTTLNLKEHVDMNEEELIQLNRLMHNFWQRQGMVRAQNLLLLQEKKNLTEENNRYIDFIKSMSVTKNVKDLETLLITTTPSQIQSSANNETANYLKRTPKKKHHGSLGM